MAENVHKDMLGLALRLCTHATDTAMASFGRAGSSIKADNTVVTEIDHRIQGDILRGIVREFPDHAVIAEETIDDSTSLPDPQAARYCWVVDPLDGTRNYACGFACFSTSIAVLERGSPIAAVVVEHNTRQTYTAMVRDGAKLNGRPIRAADPPQHQDVLVGIPSSKDSLSVRVVREWSAAKGLICRNLGSAAYHLALVASGALAGTFCKQCKLWDIAAGALLVHEAGGVVTNERGSGLFPFRLDQPTHIDLPILAAPSGMHQRLLATVIASLE
jgi:myo-inositol-1(or 4)-monophosphatase